MSVVVVRYKTKPEQTQENLAIVHGVIAEDRFAIEGAIGRDPRSRISIRRAVLLDGTTGTQPARTEITVLQRLPAFTLVRAVPRTGRISKRSTGTVRSSS